MRGKRSKQYRKLMAQFEMTFVDAQVIQDTEKFKMDLVGGLERTLSGKVKPMITQCSIRHLYLLKEIPQSTKEALILTAKTMERRRCNHHVLDEPLSTLECFNSVIDPKNSLTNKNRYVVASQDENVRRYCRGIKGVPLVYVKRSVMIIEPMATSSVNVREGMERKKFRSGLKTRATGLVGKRKRDEDDGNPVTGEGQEVKSITEGDERAGKKKKAKGPKGPNPLSMKKSKKARVGELNDQKEETRTGGILDEALSDPDAGERQETRDPAVDIVDGPFDETQDRAAKRKRKRKHKSEKLEGLAAAIDSGNEGSE
ncbi:MAG: hypothetical protein ASARMPRED_002083 [Alectoria sarmentosa]|nr:MAG: hypothetical protein ASARMPRED_002083 [Alectoria sarmentosa]